MPRMTETEQLLLENPPFRAWLYLARVYNVLAAKLTDLVESHGITGAQYGVLRCISDAGPEGLMLSDLSKRLLVTCGNITGVVDRMEQAGYLRRERQSDDRRVVRALLTNEGETLFRKIRPEYQGLVRDLMADLSPAEIEGIAVGCERLHERWVGPLAPKMWPQPAADECAQEKKGDQE